MTRDYKRSELMNRARAKRERALGRPELRDPSIVRVSAAGPVSMGVKAIDPNHDKMVEDFLAAKRGTKCGTR